jgi:hypothetical protein
MEMKTKPKVIFAKATKARDGDVLTFNSGDEDAIYHLRFWRHGEMR